MAEFIFLVAALMEEEEEALERRRVVRSLRDNSDPFSLKEYIFIQNFGFPKSLCKALIQDLEPYDQKTGIPLSLRFLACLYFFKHGSHQKSMQNCDKVPMSQSSISRSIHFISKLITDIKGNKEIQFPKTEQDILDVKKGFETTYGLKDIVGAIDCTHVGFITPSEADAQGNPSDFMNEKGTYSVHVEAICDHRLIFRAVNARSPGSCSRSDVWMNTPIRMLLQKNYQEQSDTKSFLLGGKGYPVEPWLLAPLPEPALVTPLPDSLDSKEIKFNKLHAKGHSTIGKAFGALRTRFRCLSKQRILHYSPVKTCNIVYACIVLHNILLKHGMAADIDLEELSEETTQIQQEQKESDTDNTYDFDDDLENSDFYLDGEELFEIKEGTKVRERYIKAL